MRKYNLMAVSLMLELSNENRLKIYEYRKRKHKQNPDTIFSVIVSM